LLLVFERLRRLRLRTNCPRSAPGNTLRLIGYGVNILALYRRAAYFVDRILKGAKPADLPIDQPTKFELFVNLKTAKTLDLAISETFLVRADGVIE
jgi:putative tryptophan/tyrosine transport system substrate-binding protein